MVEVSGGVDGLVEGPDSVKFVSLISEYVIVINNGRVCKVIVGAVEQRYILDWDVYVVNFDWVVWSQ